MNLKRLDAFYREIRTLELKGIPIQGDRPALSLEHYEQSTSLYEKEVENMRELALSVILMMKPRQIQFNVNRLAMANERFDRFWKWYSEQYGKYRRSELDYSEFFYQLDGYLLLNYSRQELSVPHIKDFLALFHDLHDAVMFKQGGVNISSTK